MTAVARLPLGRSFGVMQGRLSPQSARGYQTFPSETWVQEFETARHLGFEHIEWVLESFDLHNNPVLKAPESIRAQIDSFGVEVLSVCADFLMDSPLDPENTEAWGVFNQLMHNAKDLEIEVVVVPCVDSSSLLRPENLDRLEASLPQMIHTAERWGVALALETDLPPRDFRELLATFESPLLSVNYDSGNSASLGYVFEEEIEAYGDRISDFHLKDRTFGGNSVSLGTGSANFPGVFTYLSPLSFDGIVTMQAMRDNLGLYATTQQLEWIRSQLKPQGEESPRNV